ncbi:MAG: sigma-70 family RNA polymerase sigma factor [Myxococcaceae bacterium]|nr:sigma-70 family RNA polymerase sigma factor [Myxococcaceae bacterium]
MFGRSDESLYRALIDGELSAFDTLYERYERPLFGFLRRQLGDAAEAEDVLHETFMAVLKEREKGRGARSFKAWLFAVARHLCLNRVRARQRSAKANDGVAQVIELTGPAPNPDEVLAHRQTADSLKAAVTKLPPPLSELYHLRAGGLSYEELAEVLGVPIGTVKSRLHELVKRLKEEVAS